MSGADRDQGATPSGATTARIDAYLATLPDDMRQALGWLRRTLQAAAPEAVEAISYGAPALRYRDRPLVAYRAAKAHCAFYPMSPSVQGAFRAELAGYETSKGTIRFTLARPIPKAVITGIVKARLAEIDASG